MLGNFSFGDYFKREAIEFAWDFCVRELELPVDKLYVSIFNGEAESRRSRGGARVLDGEGSARDHIVEMGRKDNFWGPAGGTGACGPCSEIYFDLGAGACTCGGGCKAGDDCRATWSSGTSSSRVRRAGRRLDAAAGAPRDRHGMGLERLALIVQGKASIFETDLFEPVVAEVARLAGLAQLPALGRPEEPKGVALCIIADHVRALTFGLGEGIAPSNEGRGYVLRRLLAPRSRNGRLLGLTVRSSSTPARS